jgi:hypothetical protein
MEVFNMEITMEMIQGMDKEARANLARNLEFELDRLYDTKDEFEYILQNEVIDIEELTEEEDEI